MGCFRSPKSTTDESTRRKKCLDQLARTRQRDLPLDMSRLKELAACLLVQSRQSPPDIYEFLHESVANTLSPEELVNKGLRGTIIFLHGQEHMCVLFCSGNPAKLCVFDPSGSNSHYVRDLAFLATSVSFLSLQNDPLSVSCAPICLLFARALQTMDQLVASTGPNEKERRKSLLCNIIGHRDPHAILLTFGKKRGGERERAGRQNLVREGEWLSLLNMAMHNNTFPTMYPTGHVYI